MKKSSWQVTKIRITHRKSLITSDVVKEAGSVFCLCLHKMHLSTVGGRPCFGSSKCNTHLQMEENGLGAYRDVSGCGYMRKAQAITCVY